MDNLDYGVIGNCTSAALVSRQGTIEWACLPYFDSTAFFAKILDRNIGGEFAIRVAAGYKISQYYLHKTNICVTSFSAGPRSV
jgi:GH15 family glucan-1,4-alpha-glucosidase